MFSLADIKPLVDKTVRLKVDQRAPNHDTSATRFKATRYVPEIVMVDADLNVLARIDSNSGFDVAVVKAKLGEALKGK